MKILSLELSKFDFIGFTDWDRGPTISARTYALIARYCDGFRMLDPNNHKQCINVPTPCNLEPYYENRPPKALSSLSLGPHQKGRNDTIHRTHPQNTICARDLY